MFVICSYHEPAPRGYNILCSRTQRDKSLFRNIGLQYVQRPGYEHLIPYTRRHLNRLYRDFSPREHEFKPISRT